MDPTADGSPFVWRLTTTDTHSDTVSVMRYSNWDMEQPQSSSVESCVWLSVGRSGKWHDDSCVINWCFICEIDI